MAITGFAVAVLLGLLAGLIWGLGKFLAILSPVIWPLAVAGVLSYMLDPLVDFIEKKGATRARAIIIVFGMALVIATALGSSILPHLINESRQLSERIPVYISTVQKRAENFLSNPPPWARKLLERSFNPAPNQGEIVLTNSVQEAITTNAPAPSVSGTNAPSLLGGALNKENLQTATGYLTSALPRVGSWLFGQVGRVVSWFGVLAGVALVPVYTFYFLLEKRGISLQWTDYLPVSDSRFKHELVFVLTSMNNYLITFFRGQLLVAMCDGILYTIGFVSIGLPYAVLIGALAIILTMIPFLGAIITCVTALIIAFVQFGDWTHPLLVLAVFGVVQTLEGLVISPKIMGGRVGLHPLTIIIAVMAGTTLLGGLLGGILAIPLTAAMRVLMFRYVWKRPAA